MVHLPSKKSPRLPAAMTPSSPRLLTTAGRSRPATSTASSTSLCRTPLVPRATCRSSVFGSPRASRPLVLLESGLARFLGPSMLVMR
ncbi:hypothetical protein LB505_003319 [Fusarium chuoi]|nr:hypothetical protein LB505_003319 [Fusarium chuoi]